MIGAVVLSTPQTWALVLVVVAGVGVLAMGPAAVRARGREARVRVAGEGTPRRRAGAELQADGFVDHEQLGWFGASDGRSPSIGSAPREAARFTPYPLSITTTRKRAA